MQCPHNWQYVKHEQINAFAVVYTYRCSLCSKEQQTNGPIYDIELPSEVQIERIIRRPYDRFNEI